MTQKFGRLALHMWTIDTTPLATALDAARAGGFDAVELRRTDFKRCFDTGMSNEQVLALIRASGIPVGVFGVEYGWLFATSDESKRLFKVFRESCENAVALGCAMLMSAPGPVEGPISDAIKHLRQASDIAGEYGLRLAIEFNSQHPVLNKLGILRELIEGASKENCGYLIDTYHFARSGAPGRGFESVPPNRFSVSSTATFRPVQLPAWLARRTVCRPAKAWFSGARYSGCWRKKATRAISVMRRQIPSSGHARPMMWPVKASN